MDTVDRSPIPGERCGRCGADASASDGWVCPSCGALLAAYRDPATVPASVTIDSPREREPIRSNPDPAWLDEQADTDIPLFEPVEASATVEDDVQPEAPAPQLDPAPSPPSRVTVTTSRPVAEPVLAPPLPVVAPRRAVTPDRPRRPGWVAAGTVEPVVLYGALAMVFGCILVGLASAFAGRAVAGVGFVVFILGLVATIVAVLAALVRRESERR